MSFDYCTKELKNLSARVKAPDGSNEGCAVRVIDSDHIGEWSFITGIMRMVYSKQCSCCTYHLLRY
ncbi:unnamed protein product [Anisakis simplex]|uniref:Tudor domain-containing protein n=1 Tax=Anisakis simplex TaxID=6269 RepID=A0A0M3JQH0_ANISI|nr:unnamed protein product [Anisakis simplex]